MAKITWWEAIEIVKSYVVKVSTPSVTGTGFLCAYTESKMVCGIATAAHVVNKSHIWEEPIRIQHFNSGETKLLHASNRAVHLDLKLDTAVILFAKGKIPFPENTLTFLSEKKALKAGNEIGWVGFPSVSPDNLCFFTGRISCWVNDSRTYLVDGVAINGVSGGPVFYTTTKGIEVIGSVSAYLPNRVGVTPGLAIVSHAEPFQKTIKTIKNMEDAKKKEALLRNLKKKD